MTTPRPVLTDLSPTEFLVLRRLGFCPVGLAVGSCLFDTGYRTMINLNLSTEPMPFIGAAMHTARRTALARLSESAAAVGAEGVVGVRLEFDQHRWHGGEVVAKFVALGTAIVFDRAGLAEPLASAPSLRLARGPFTSDLSAHDFALLLRAGYRPVTIAFGNSVWTLGKRILAGMGNAEVEDYTQAYAQAREEAMEDLVADLHQDFPPGSADAPCGVVGMTVSESDRGFGSAVEFTAVGTAVARASRGDPRVGAAPPEPTVVVPLDR